MNAGRRVSTFSGMIWLLAILLIAGACTQEVQDIPLKVTISPLAHDTAATAMPTFHFSASSAHAPTAPAIQRIYYQVDTWNGPWLEATPAGGTASGTTPPLANGVHVLYAFATDGQDATSIVTGRQSSPSIGQISAYVFFVDAAPGEAD